MDENVNITEEVNFDEIDLSSKNENDVEVPDDSTPATSDEPKKTPKSWYKVEIVQDCRFGWTLENISKFLDGWSVVNKQSHICHDKCQTKDYQPREPHCHLYLKFNNPVPTSAIIARAKKVGLPDDCITENRLQKIKNWKAALNYQTHRDCHLDYKHVYDVNEVHANFDWQAECEDYHSNEDLRVTNVRQKQIVEAIYNGEITEYNLDEHLSIVEQVNYDSAIRKAFARTNERKWKNMSRTMEVIFISGASGIGKDTLAVEWCKSRGLAYYRTNNNPDNPFDNYRGQPVIIWSDARDDVFKPHNLHQLLDNHFGSMQKSRYHDKFLGADVMIITSIKPLEDWYTKFYANEKEDKTQLYRRIGTKYVMDEEHVHIYDYNGATKSYTYVGKMPNLYMHEDVYRDTYDKQLCHALELLGNLSDGFTPAKEGETPDTPFTNDNPNSGNPFIQQELPKI